MVATDIRKQGQIENQMLQHLMDALRTTLAWRVDGRDMSRKLSTLRFIAQAFQRTLEYPTRCVPPQGGGNAL